MKNKILYVLYILLKDIANELDIESQFAYNYYIIDNVYCRENKFTSIKEFRIINNLEIKWIDYEKQE